MKKIIFYMPIVAALMAGCTKNFESYNRNPYGITQEELNRIPQGGTQLLNMQKYVLPDQENSYQLDFDLSAAGYAGYASQFKLRVDYPTYNPRLSWVSYIWEDIYPKMYPQYFDILSVSKGDMEGVYYLAWANILRVGTTHWLTDTFGPLPYSKMVAGQTNVVYDSQRDLYFKMCEDLKVSIERLKRVDPNDRQYATYDLVYDGDMSKWAKYAASLLLRIAVRMSNVAPTEAQQYAEYAVQSGVITDNSENAIYKTPLVNPLFRASSQWGDSLVSSEIVEYMNAYADPRMEAYFTKVTTRTGREFFGVRAAGTPAQIDNPGDYSLPKLEERSPITWITASEVAFLKAEGALKGWNMGGETAEALYRRGIEFSFGQHGVAIGNYLDNTSRRGNFSDEKYPAFNESFSSDISVKWDENASNETKLGKIITQKWIAMYPYGGQEAWAEWRRTGYPNLLLGIASENRSGGVISNIRQVNGKDRGGMRRLFYSFREYQTNAENVNEAVNFLGGADNGATDLWWAR